MSPACSARRSEQSAATQAPRPVIFIGLDGADWQLLDDYVARGAMPNLAALVRDGTSGVLETMHPPLSPLVWTTMMTGVGPIEHGILDFIQFDPKSGEREPITSSVRAAPAIWNMASAQGKRVAVFGLWATYPAEPVDGVLVSDRLFTFLYKEGSPPPGVVYPAEREAWARAALDRAEQSTDEAAVKAYLPWLTGAEYRRNSDADDPYAQPVSALRRILVETRVYDDLGRDVPRAFDGRLPDLTILYFQGTDSIGHVFAPYAPPRQPSIPEADYEKYSSVPERYFRAIDDQLGAYRRIAEGAHGVLMLASDHGFFWKDGRPTTLSSNAKSTAAKWHRNEGMYVLWGDGISASPDSAAHGRRGSVQQVCATLLALLGLPAGRDVDGDPLAGAPASTLPRADYAAGYHPAAPPSATPGRSAGDADTLAKLKSLGYIGDAGPSSSRTAGGTRTPGSYNNEGLILRDKKKDTQAIEAFERALALDPSMASAAWNLSDLLFTRGNDLDRADDLLLKAFANGLPDGTKLLVGRAIGYQRGGQVDRSLKLIDAGLRVAAKEPELWLFRGRYRVDRGDCAGAAGDFQQAERLAPGNPASFASEGLARMCSGDRAGARRAFARSLELDPNQPKVREFLNDLGRTP